MLAMVQPRPATITGRVLDGRIEADGKGGPKPNPVDRYEREDGTLDVECWCTYKVMRVQAADVRAGRTGSCGRSRCKPHPPTLVLAAAPSTP
jgi:hypothetical protein